LVLEQEKVEMIDTRPFSLLDYVTKTHAANAPARAVWHVYWDEVARNAYPPEVIRLWEEMKRAYGAPKD
jgi:hypothetical protein